MKIPLSVVSYVWFYIGWFGCLWCGLNGYSIFSIGFGFISLWLMSQLSPVTRKLLVYISIIFGVGLTFDIFMLLKKNITITTPFIGLAPAWLISMWIMYVSVVPKTVAAFDKKIWLAAILGGIMGPLSYKYGDASGLLKFAHPWSLYFYAAFWFVFFPISVVLKRRF